MTNYSGFYRYDIGDVVEVLFYEQAPARISPRRGGYFLLQPRRQLNFM